MSSLFGGIGDWAKDVIDRLGYFGLACLVALENVFPPIPSELILPLAGFLTSEGRMWYPGAVFAATIGSVAGAGVLYGIGQWFGDRRLRALIRRYGRWFGVKESDLDRANDWFDRYGVVAVMICRLVPVVRSLISLPAGLRRMRLGQFAIYTAIGSAAWNAILIGTGWWLGDNWERVGDWVGYFQYLVIAAVLGAAAWFFWKRKIAPRRTAM